MKLTPISDTNFYGPEKRMAAERERIRAEKAAAEAKIAAEKAGGGDSPSPATSSTPAPTI